MTDGVRQQPSRLEVRKNQCCGAGAARSRNIEVSAPAPAPGSGSAKVVKKIIIHIE
jgi:hypothetical protein